MSVRIVAGLYGGRSIAVPKSITRPTSSKVREAVFSALGPLSGETVLDLFAGSGALGLEAVSRGANSVTFVEKDRRAGATIAENIDELGEGRAEVVTSDARRFVERMAGVRAFDLVFLDPPYQQAADLSGPLSATLPGVLSSQARVIVESDRRNPLQLNMNMQWERRYGDTVVRIYHV